MGRLSAAIAGVVCLAGCEPSLSRSDGRLEVEVVGLAAGVRTVELTLAASGAEPYSVRIPRSGSEPAVRLAIESVPAGPALLTAAALAGGVRVQSWSGTVDIAPDTVRRVTVRPLEGAQPRETVLSGPISVPIGPLGGADIAGARLGGRAEVPAAALTAFLDRARAQLGYIERAGLSAARVILDVASSSDVDDFREAWRDTLELSLGDGASSILVAASPPPDDGAEASLAVLPAAELGPFFSSGAPLYATLAGRAKRDASDQFRVRVVVELVLFAAGPNPP